MNSYKIRFTVNGSMTETVVRATSDPAARKLIEAQYPGCRINFYEVKRI